MWSFHRSNQDENRRLALTLALGAAGGLALGLLIGRRPNPVGAGELGANLRSRARRAAARLTPERRIRTPWEDDELVRLEDSVIDAFLQNPTLSERGIDVGAISRGIVELSGSVRSEAEADLAVRIANDLPGVQTVVNRLDLEDESRQRDAVRRRIQDGDPALTSTRWEGRRVGMGRMRQGPQTEPDRPDDSQKQTDKALEMADRLHWEEEQMAAQNSRMTERPEDDRPGSRPDFDHDELDNQDPHRRGHAPETLSDRPQALRGRTRVGEGLKPGTELRLEDADIPLKPHSDIGPEPDPEVEDDLR
jgi:hypothetical protein